MSGLLGATEIREIAARLGVVPTKKLGQNFVVDANTCRRIVKSADVTETDIALEIGPGLGSLTLALMETAASVVVIEIDSRLAAELPVTAERHGFNTELLSVITQDALTVNELPMNPTVLVANLPYNISVPVLLNFLEKFPTLRAGVVMVQSEVADRLAAKPNTKSYGSPSVKANWWAEMSLAGTVGRTIFWPIPNVDSALVKFVRHPAPGDEALRKATFAIIEAAFAQRRKMLRGALSELFGSSAAASEIMVRAGVDPTLRGEALELTQFIAIANAAQSA
ncbi:MAG: 16S rRNA (adenine(1518)-N(6)/adenine(1519)-N(6))-dimethyltransferase RsmA [Actinomycetes bacterium]